MLRKKQKSSGGPTMYMSAYLAIVIIFFLYCPNNILVSTSHRQEGKQRRRLRKREREKDNENERRKEKEKRSIK
jgi:hypothetical protein